ncbi:hypothetical protein BZA05DRAFT_343095 [Tricharina praecox]|uniref:uncharacterized protein n=1 Tax=Tricharina praecox TaxID=43433 RepID=UPI0022206F2F|nr:uncharacterized protein BZA05DRAFT_343095 [Tricharina praecox]KAI5844284.1 hypothetical protein BZA05DRAFT_343095 [Tricharina praecox]
MRWSDGPTDASIFWLNGEAGIGKSTIARTVARMWADEKRLGASFCFVRGWGDMAHASKFFTTLAYQLACVHPNIATGVYKTLCDYPDVPRQSLREQWKYLILEPLSRLDGVSHPQSLILVIDALDECDDENDIALILLLLSQAGTLKSVRLQVFITSRPEAQIRYGFDNIPKACFTVFELDTITSLSRLVEKADGLA